MSKEQDLHYELDKVYARLLAFENSSMGPAKLRGLIIEGIEARIEELEEQLGLTGEEDE